MSSVIHQMKNMKVHKNVKMSANTLSIMTNKKPKRGHMKKAVS